MVVDRGFRIFCIGFVSEGENLFRKVQRIPILIEYSGCATDPPIAAIFSKHIQGQPIASQDRRRHLDSRVAFHLVYQSGDKPRWGQRRIPLQIHHNIRRLGQFLNRFCNPLCPVATGWGGHDHLASKTIDHISDALIVRGHKYPTNTGHIAGGLPTALNKRLARASRPGQHCQRLAFKSL